MLKELLNKKAEYEANLVIIQECIKDINIDIDHVLAESMASLRKMAGKEFGTVNLLMDGVRITETIPKKIEWDQEKMNALFDAIATAGDDPRAYMRLKLEVSEKAYAEFVPAVQSMFADCRTVKPGKASLKFEEVAA